jgi:hypothetical protein
MHATHSPATVCRAVVRDEIGAGLDRQLLQAFSVFEAVGQGSATMLRAVAPSRS